MNVHNKHVIYIHIYIYVFVYYSIDFVYPSGKDVRMIIATKFEIIPILSILFVGAENSKETNKCIAWIHKTC